MTFRLPKLSLILAALASLVSALPAQEGSGDLQAELEARRNKLAQKRQAQRDGEIGESKPMTAEEILEARKRRGSRGQCRFVTAMRPPKLLPGQSGTMLITAVLQGRSVMPAPSQVAMTAQPSKLVQVGSLLARPAQVGTIHEAYRGRPVYENTAVFEVPVTLTPEAKLGDKAQVAVDLEFDIYDGRTAQAVGRFIERVQAQVEVAPYADPEVEGRKMREDQTERAEPVTPPSAANGDNVGPAGSQKPDAMSGNANTVAPPQPREPVETETSDPVDDLPMASTEEGGFPTMLIVGGGAILLVIVLLLMRKK
ncbi:MAG: hypothetical protein ACE37K_09725 [Planctomycetota bacterium]